MQPNLPANMEAMHDAKLRELAARPNTTVYKPTFDHLHEPWRVARLRPVLERLMTRVYEFSEDATDDDVRVGCVHEDAEMEAFRKDHPKMYTLLTDRKVMSQQSSRDAIQSMLLVREQVEKGTVAEGRDADALATKQVVTALSKPKSPPREAQ